MRITRSPTRLTSLLTVDEDLDFLTLYKLLRLSAPASGGALRKGNKDITNDEVDDEADIALAKLASTVLTDVQVAALITAHEEGSFHRWTDEMLVKGAGAAAAVDEIAIPVSDVTKALLGIVDATVALFKANAATGDATDPENLNDGNTSTKVSADQDDRYAEVDFGKLVEISKFRLYGGVNNDGTAIIKIEYYNPFTAQYEEWVTDIPLLALSDWGEWNTSGGARFCTKIKVTWTYYSFSTKSCIYEMEVTA